MDENQEFDQRADPAKCHEEAIPVIEDFEKIIIPKKKIIRNAGCI